MNSPDGIPTPAQSWTVQDTEDFLTRQALPYDFRWPHRDPRPDGSENLQPVIPTYRLHKGYGFWLRTTPYFPGLFEEIHAVLSGWPDDRELPDAAQLAATLTERRLARGRQANLTL